MLGMTLHRITASKEVATILNKSGHCISYNDIRLLEDHWANLSSTKKKSLTGLLKASQLTLVLIIMMHVRKPWQDWEQHTTQTHQYFSH